MENMHFKYDICSFAAYPLSTPSCNSNNKKKINKNALWDRETVMVIYIKLISLCITWLGGDTIDITRITRLQTKDQLSCLP